MINVVVTGGLGFIGSNLIELLIKKKFNVINIDKESYSSNFYNTKNFSNSSNYKFIKCDLNENLKLKKIILKHRPRCIFNLAAETHVDRSIESPKNFIESNILGVFNLLEIFKEYSKKYNKSRLIHVSTDEVYGDIINGRSDENYKYQPSSPYAASKASSDHLVSSYFKTYKIPVIITNCSNNYGPKQHDEKLIPTIIRKALSGEQIPIYGDGKNIRDWLYVLDHCKGIELVYKIGKTGETYNIGGKNERDNLYIVDIICGVLDKIIPKETSYKEQISFVTDRSGHDFRYAINASKIENKLEWKAEENFETGIKKTIEWYLKKYR